MNRDSLSAVRGITHFLTLFAVIIYVVVSAVTKAIPDLLTVNVILLLLALIALTDRQEV